MTEAAVEVLREPSAEDVAALASLLPQVSSRAQALTHERVTHVVCEPTTRVIVVRLDGIIVGMAVLSVCTTLTGQFGMIEEVVVHADKRGHGLGRRLMVGLLEEARHLNLDFVQLTSRPSRVAANELYRDLGFVVRETNCYRHRFHS